MESFKAEVREELESKFVKLGKLGEDVAKHSDVLGMVKTMMTTHLNKGRLESLSCCFCTKTTKVLKNKFTGVLLEAHSTTQLSQDNVLLITGGFPPKSTTELFPSISSCSPPTLSSTRYGHTTFVTAGLEPAVATCGGFTAEKHTASCLVLNPITRH